MEFMRKPRILSGDLYKFTISIGILKTHDVSEIDLEPIQEPE